MKYANRRERHAADGTFTPCLASFSTLHQAAACRSRVLFGLSWIHRQISIARHLRLTKCTLIRGESPKENLKNFVSQLPDANADANVDRFCRRRGNLVRRNGRD